MTQDTVVLAYPYEGAFYWFLAAGEDHSQAHPYYRVLYGANPSALGSRAAAIASLYPNIVLAPADTLLPDYRSYSSGATYHNPELRLSLNYAEDEWAPETQEIARAAAIDPETRRILAGNILLAGDEELQYHFLCRTALQIRLAAREGGTLIGDAFFQRVYATVAPWVTELCGASAEAPAASRLALGETALSITGLDFAPASLDAFEAIRDSKEVAAYATSFRAALVDAQDYENLDDRLTDLMIEAMDSQAIADKAKTAFQTAGSVTSILGFVPLIGTVASAVGVGTDVGGRIATSRSEGASWYLLGAKLKEIALRDALERRRAS